MVKDLNSNIEIHKLPNLKVVSRALPNLNSNIEIHKSKIDFEIQEEEKKFKF